MGKHEKHEEKRIVKAHDQVNHLTEVIHFPDHPPRHESEEFKRVREKFHKEGAKCYINNGFCEGNIEIHHNVVEWAAANAVDWQKVKAEFGFDHVDAYENMLPLCHKHHQAPGFGIHKISFPAWRLQRFMKREHLEAFEKAVKRLIEQGHEEHHVNHHANKLLLHLHRKGDAHARHEQQRRGHQPA